MFHSINIPQLFLSKTCQTDTKSANSSVTRLLIIFVNAEYALIITFSPTVMSSSQYCHLRVFIIRAHMINYGLYTHKHTHTRNDNRFLCAAPFACSTPSLALSIAHTYNSCGIFYLRSFNFVVQLKHFKWYF